MKNLLPLFAVAGLLCVAPVLAARSAPQDTPPAAPAKETEADPRIKVGLDKLKYKFTLTTRKNYQLTFDLKDKRSQVVFINSATETFGKLEIREVTSTAYKVKGKLSAEQASRLLADNDKRKWGGWRTVLDEGFTYVIYAVQLPADSDSTTLDSAIDAVMYTADDMEKEMSKEDEF